MEKQGQAEVLKQLMGKPERQYVRDGRQVKVCRMGQSEVMRMLGAQQRKAAIVAILKGASVPLDRLPHPPFR
jgi:hypothetical protein